MDSDPPLILFLDDCPERRHAFRRRSSPAATIVSTAAACIWHLTAGIENGIVWDEVHLDHDLSGGIPYIDQSRDDTGMEVVRYIVTAKPDIMTIIVHTHNEYAGPVMVNMLEAAGYRVVRAPFSMLGFGD